jgi:protein required for attachment to host cells
MKSTRTWFLIADGSRARVVENLGRRRGFRDIEDMSLSIDLPPSRDVLTDRPGRGHASYGRGRYAKENTGDPHRELKRAFAKMIGLALNAKLAAGGVERLIVVAPPTFMGDLRAALPKGVRTKVSGEVTEDLTNLPKQRLHRHLERMFGS